MGRPRIYIPSSPACGQWETLLADALDGLLKPEDERLFAEHMAGCQACTALFDEARRGREWLEFLSPEPEVPAGLLDKILAQTGSGQVAGFGLMTGNTKVASDSTSLAASGLCRPDSTFCRAERLLMTAAMAFFSIALTLNLTGVRLSGLRMANLRPTAVRSFMERRFTTASVPIIRYYDHLRFVYEVESRMRELRQTEEGEDQGQRQGGRQSTPSNSTPGESKQTPGGKDGGSRMDPLQQSGKPAAQPATGPVQNLSGDYEEASLTFEWNIPAHSGGSRTARGQTR